jgi:hypothetical protein
MNHVSLYKWLNGWTGEQLQPITLKHLQSLSFFLAKLLSALGICSKTDKLALFSLLLLPSAVYRKSF